MSQTIMERLKEETKTAHQQLEKATVPFIRSATDNEQYEVLLRLFFGYFRPMEEKIQGMVPISLLADIGERRQTVALLNDLKNIGAPTENIPQATNLPEISTIAKAIGAMYVLEGSTLGGRFITQMLMKSLNHHSSEYISFFSGYGESTSDKWKHFTQMVNQYAEKFPDHHQEIIDSASQTFTKFGNWVVLSQETTLQTAVF